MGRATNDQCVGGKLKKRQSFSEREVHLFEVRTGALVTTVCEKHDKRYRLDYAFREKRCCDPFGKHKSNLPTKQLWTIPAGVHDRCREIFPAVIEGQKLCISCKKTVLEHAHKDEQPPQVAGGNLSASDSQPGHSGLQEFTSSSDNKTASDDTDEKGGSGSPYAPDKEAVEKVNRTLHALGESPLKSKIQKRRHTNEKKRINPRVC